MWCVVHHTCVDMSSRTYSSLTRSSKEWFCYHCNSINSSIYNECEYTVPTRNSFSLLNHNLSTPLDDDVFTSLKALHAHSSLVSTSIPHSAASIHSGTRSTESSHQVHHNSEPSRQHSNLVSAPTGVNWRTILLNANSIFGKSAELHHLLDYTKADAVLINESKLDSEISTPEVIPANLGYTVYRKDWNRHGGGVMILIKTCYSSQIADIKSDAELLWIDVQLKNQRKLLLSTFYRPPSSDDEYLKLFDASLLDIHTRTANDRNPPIIVGGDFNLPDINWEHNCVSASSSKNKLHNSFLSTLADHNLSQMVTEPTRKDHILDLMLTNNPSIIKNVQILPGFSDHEFVLSDSNLAPSYARKLPRKIHLFSKANWAEVCQKISDFSATHSNTMSELDINTKWNALKKQLNEIMDSCIPTKMTTTRHNVPWINRTMIHLTAWSRYKSCKKQVTQQMRKARSDYVNNIIESAFQEADTKPFWKFIYSKRGKKIGDAPLKSQGKLFADGRCKAEILNNQFKFVFIKEKSSDIPTPYGPNFPPIGNIQENINGVQKLLSNIEVNKATGPDNLPCRILKEAAPDLAPILTDIFQHSLRDGVLPDDWKKAQVSPVFKKGNTNNAENYRPISLTCVSCKLLEHIICHHIHEHLDKHSIVSSLQHGFRSRHSCESQLLITAHDLGKSYNEKKQVDIAILDFSKAFDKVLQQRLLGKLRHYGITGQTCGWIQAFLSNRTQCVVKEPSWDLYFFFYS